MKTQTAVLIMCTGIIALHEGYRDEAEGDAQ